MNKLQDNQISTDFGELSEEQQILQDAEQIIKQTQSEKKHTGQKGFFFLFFALVNIDYNSPIFFYYICFVKYK